ncbi:PINc/VapC family ATPase [Picrophilus oshimae]|uniref:PilT ATPase n=1 Tax=Picrophilus torridus (strain ATCC 700027 / DSM 9790 / JCM 10055 / NBRC 100828 / KAW 2/3) TaxID=1122961 RepID=Q6KZV6_PICTO|nr:PINc/VapC family ATPase [Picrophilus oshimae]AAT43746.1 putative PilT ATPase [Picrophilus oshimae DSM 9789]
MEYVPDTSVIVDGRFTSFISDKAGSRVILAEAMLAEVEHQANEGRSIGFAALEELKNLRKLADDGIIYIDIYGNRPQDWQIRRAKSGEIDNIIRNIALENDAVLVTGDNIQRDIAMIKGIKVEYLNAIEKNTRNIEEFFGENTTSVHLKANMKPVVKNGYPGRNVLEELDEIVSYDELENIASNIVKRGKLEDESFIEMDMYGATVIQLKNIRIVITRPPFSDSLEITAVRPIKKLDIDDYNLDKRLIERLENKASGILVSGAPGAGKSTFVTALAEFYAGKGKIVKTMEKPRDLQVSNKITQYTSLEGDMEKTGDILLLVREDYTVFDEMRVTSDFKVYSDLRLAGVGMIGVVHATKALDAIQRFIGRVELGLIPQIVDTVIYIENGGISQVLTTEYTVKIPAGMKQEDLARPVIIVKDFLSNKPVSEIYSFGNEIVVVPVGQEISGNAIYDLASRKIEDEVKRFLNTDKVLVRIDDDTRATVSVPETKIPRLIGKKGENISNLEKQLNIKLDVEPLKEDLNEKQEAIIEIKNKTLYIDVGIKNKPVRLYVDGIMIMRARTSAKGMVRIKINSDTGSSLYKYIKDGKKIEYMVEE